MKVANGDTVRISTDEAMKCVFLVVNGRYSRTVTLIAKSETKLTMGCDIKIDVVDDYDPLDH